MPLIQELRNLLEQKLHTALKMSWLEECLCALKSNRSLDVTNLPLADLANMVEKELLDTDLGSTCIGSLPQNVSQIERGVLDAVPAYLVQIEELVNIGESSEKRYENSPHRTLKMALYDGNQRVVALELTRLHQLNLNSPLGMKVLIKNVLVCHGIVSLHSHNLNILGGSVKPLIEYAKWLRVQQKKSFIPKEWEDELGAVELNEADSCTHPDENDPLFGDVSPKRAPSTTTAVDDDDDDNISGASRKKHHHTSADVDFLSTVDITHDHPLLYDDPTEERLKNFSLRDPTKSRGEPIFSTTLSYPMAIGYDSDGRNAVVHLEEDERPESVSPDIGLDEENNGPFYVASDIVTTTNLSSKGRRDSSVPCSPPTEIDHNRWSDTRHGLSPTSLTIAQEYANYIAPTFSGETLSPNDAHCCIEAEEVAQFPGGCSGICEEVPDESLEAIDDLVFRIESSQKSPGEANYGEQFHQVELVDFDLEEVDQVFNTYIRSKDVEAIEDSQFTEFE